MGSTTESRLVTILAGLITLLLSVIAFFLIQTYAQIDNKLDNKIFLQYFKLIEERNSLQHEINTKTIENNKEILKRLDELNETIHTLDVRIVGVEAFRGRVGERWNYEDLVCFAWENGVTFDYRDYD